MKRKRTEAEEEQVEEEEGSDRVTSKMPNIINLNVGGVSYTTHLSVLTTDIAKGTFFETLLAGSFSPAKDSSGAYFIDRDGASFRYVLNYFREPGPFVFCGSIYERELAINDARYYQMPEAYVSELELAPLASFNLPRGVDLPLGGSKTFTKLPDIWLNSDILSVLKTTQDVFVSVSAVVVAFPFGPPTTCQCYEVDERYLYHAFDDEIPECKKFIDVMLSSTGTETDERVASIQLSAERYGLRQRDDSHDDNEWRVPAASHAVFRFKKATEWRSQDNLFHVKPSATCGSYDDDVFSVSHMFGDVRVPYKSLDEFRRLLRHNDSRPHH
jgi:hypothetical protein